MRKEQLKKLRRLDATPVMMQLAAKDVPVRERRWRYADPEDKYNTCIYMRCQTLGGILKVAFFLPDIMRLGCKRASYELFINNETGEFLTYDVQHEKWSEAKLDMLQWPAYCYISNSDKWINPEGNKTIKTYLGVQNGGYRGIMDYQLRVREEQLKQRYRKETERWDQDMEQIPQLPKDWDRWVNKVGITQNFIFYEYRRLGAKTGYCTWCEKDVPVEHPRHNKAGRCPCCGHNITFKAEGKAGTFDTNSECVYLLQRSEDGFVIRCFQASMRYTKGEYKTPRKSCYETRRTIYDKLLRGRAYYWGDYKQHELRWISGNISSYYHANGRVYGRTVPDLARNELSQTGLADMVRALNKMDPEWYLEKLRYKPYLEQLAKAGLMRLAYEVADNYQWEKKNLHVGGELHKRLEIDKRQLRRLRENNGGTLFLTWLEFEKSNLRSEIPDGVIAWYEREKIKPEDLDFIRDRMSEVQVCNYLQRQMRETGEESRQLLRTWADYLSMGNRLKMNTSDAIIYRCKKLKQRHDELVKLFQNKEIAIQAGAIAKTYPHVDDICKTVKEKYEYASDTYLVMAPTCIEDIIAEGRALNHCVGKSERYFERIENNEAYVLFLRKTEEPDKPYYTLEIEPGGTVRQKRTMFDRQNADIQDAEKFLCTWQKEVSKRMTENDLLLAEESRDLRIRGFEELRENGKTIPTGELRGKLLVEVLQADLMENSVRRQTKDQINKEEKSA